MLCFGFGFVIVVFVSVLIECCGVWLCLCGVSIVSKVCVLFTDCGNVLSVECRIGLRATSKNVSAATAYILSKREKKKKLKEEERQRSAERSKKRRWGKTSSGNFVNSAHVDGLFVCCCCCCCCCER